MKITKINRLPKRGVFRTNFNSSRTIERFPNQESCLTRARVLRAAGFTTQTQYDPMNREYQLLYRTT